MSSLHAQLKLAGIFSDNMVLQQNQKVKIWGTADAGASVKIKASWNGIANAMANDMGEWETFIRTPKAGNNSYQLTIISNNDTISLKNVVTGEVWVCSGQSNMRFQLRRSKGVEKDTLLANNSQIRLYASSKVGWEESTYKIASQFSAVGFYFGLNIQKKLNVPVGLILSAVGGSPIESYIPLETLQNDPKLSVVIDRRNQWLAEYKEKDSLEYYSQLSKWEANGKKGKEPSIPRSVYSIKRYHHQRGILFKDQVSLFIPYTMKGVIWYQGESNMEWPNEYEHLLSSLITSWRKAWDQGDFPFYFVQIPSYNYPTKNGVDRSLNAPILREAQYRTLKLKNTGMAGTMDVGNPENIHPNIKKPIGERLAYIALAKTYGFKSIAYSGPTYKKYSVNNNKVTVEFDHAKNGLVANGGEALWFEIAGTDGVFHPAKAKMARSKAIVSSNSVLKPKSIRYAWKAECVTNVFNVEGLPAIPFFVEVID
ncbi:MAG: sialate O-acetylesterase [Flavobacteriaceae bacterium]